MREDWWGAKKGFKRLPRIQRIIYVPQQEESQAAQLLLTDQLDMAPIMQVLTLESVLERNARVVTFRRSAAALRLLGLVSHRPQHELLGAAV